MDHALTPDERVVPDPSNASILRERWPDFHPIGEPESANIGDITPPGRRERHEVHQSIRTLTAMLELRQTNRRMLTAPYDAGCCN